jgi:hydrogenase maturation factor HypF (carbamoyltransferase family)
MKESMTHSSICPRCHKPYRDRPALSRLDNETLICPDCGAREALAYIGVNAQEQDEIIEAMHRYPRGCSE